MVQLPSDRHRPSAKVPGERRTGRVRWFDHVQGVGIVHVPGLGQAHVHHKEIRREGYRALDPGDKVSFWVDETGRGPVLRDVRLVKSLPRE